MKKLIWLGAVSIALFAVTTVARAAENFGFEKIFEDSVSVDLKVNGQDGPVKVERGERIVVSWISDGATRCRGNWSRNDIKTSGTVAGKISKSAIIKIACINGNGDRDDDSVVVNVSGGAVINQPTPVTQPTDNDVYMCRLDLLNGDNITREAITIESSCLARICDVLGPQNAARGISSKCLFQGKEIKRYNTTTTSAQPTITVLSPNGGESFKVGDTITVKWTTKDLPAGQKFVFVDLLGPKPGLGPNQGDERWTTRLSSGTPNDGTEEFMLPVSLESGKYLILVLVSGGVGPDDESDARFTITAPTTTAKPMGDLTVASFSWKPESPTTSTLDPYVYFTAVIKNSGADTLSIPIGTKFSLFKNGLNVGGVEVGVGYTLAAGESKTLDFTSTQSPNLRETSGIFALTFTADSFNAVTESNKNNNTITKSITITAPTTTAQPAISVNLKANGSDGPITVAAGTSVTLAYTTTGKIAECKGDVSGYDTGSVSVTANATKTYSVTCSQDGGTGSASDTVTVNVTPTTITTTPSASTAPTITVTGPSNSFGAPGSTAVSFTSSGVSTVKVEACVNKTDCTVISSASAVAGASTSVRWDFNGTEPYVGAPGTKPIYLKVTDLASGVFDFSDSYIYISPATSGSAESNLAGASVPGADVLGFLKAFFGRW